MESLTTLHGRSKDLIKIYTKVFNENKRLIEKIRNILKTESKLALEFESGIIMRIKNLEGDNSLLRKILKIYLNLPEQDKPNDHKR